MQETCIATQRTEVSLRSVLQKNINRVGTKYQRPPRWVAFDGK